MGRFEAIQWRRAVLTGAMAIASLSLMSGNGSAQTGDACPNAEYRLGPAATLPDCRAYELVSPADSGGHRPLGRNLTNSEGGFETPLVAADGNSVVFQTAMGALKGFGGTGFNDRYRAVRSTDGWATTLFGPEADEMELPVYGGFSANHELQFVTAIADIVGPPPRGSIAETYDVPSNWLRNSAGEYEPLATGSLGDQGRAGPGYISDDARHVIFTTSNGAYPYNVEQLEPVAPPSGTTAVYDREFNGQTHVVSLLPGDITPSDGEHANFVTSSPDGTLVAFRMAATDNLYVRIDNSRTDLVAAGPNAAAGIYGRHVFYSNAALSGGGSPVQTPSDLLSYDTSTQTTTTIVDTGDAQFVNVSADGNRVYFVSPTQIDGAGTAGEPNMYVWERASGAIQFVATVNNADVTTDLHPDSTQAIENLVRLVPVTVLKDINQALGVATSRTTPDGSVIVFESTAQLTDYDNGGYVEIYRYDVTTGDLRCVSCGSAEPPSADASFQTLVRNDLDGNRPLNALAPVDNLSQDGGTVVFESREALVTADVNGRNDVYRWRAGEGLSLVSTGRSSIDSFLFAVTPDASDILFVTTSQLVPVDQNGATGALYTARVNGGLKGQFETAGSTVCAGDECQAGPSTQPDRPSPGSDASSAGNPSAKNANQGCAWLAHKASKLSQRVKGLQRKAEKASGKKARQLRRNAKRKSKKAKRLNRKAKSCRGASR